jgi:hypothetical protein
MRRAVAPAVLFLSLLLGRPAQAGTLPIRVSSELWPDEASALEEANRRLCDKLLAVVSFRAGESLSQEQLRRHLPRLLSRHDVRREDFTEQVGKPYGVMIRQSVCASVPDEAIDQWLADVIRERQTRWHWRFGAGVGTVFGWLGGLWAAVKLDRWTRGYRRGVILGSTLAILVGVTGYLWVALCA